MTAIAEIKWPSGAHRWLDSEFPPADAAAAKAALDAAGADAWAGYGPVGWPAHPWTAANFEAVLEAGAAAIVLAVGPLAPIGNAWDTGAQLADQWVAFVKHQGLMGRVMAGLDVEAALVGHNVGYAVDMAAEFLATLRQFGIDAGCYGPWDFQAELYALHPNLPTWAWGTGNAAANEALDSPPGYPAEAVPGHRADQFAWDVDVAGINCDLSVSQFAPATGTAAPADSPAASADGNSTATESAAPATGTAADPTPASSTPADSTPASSTPASSSPASSEPKTFDGLPVVEEGETTPGPGGLYLAGASISDRQQIDVNGPGSCVILDELAAVVYRGKANVGLGGAGAYLIVTSQPCKWAVVTQPVP